MKHHKSCHLLIEVVLEVRFISNLPVFDVSMERNQILLRAHQVHLKPFPSLSPCGALKVTNPNQSHNRTFLVLLESRI